jgi:ATP-dependent DNA helicase
VVRFCYLCIFREAKAAPEQKASQLTIKLRNVMMQLRKCCSHPWLLEHPLDKGGNLCVDERVVSQSGKMMVLDRMLQELKKCGHKVRGCKLGYDLSKIKN